MDDDGLTPDAGKPRYLLPEGFSDIGDLIHWQENGGQEPPTVPKVDLPSLPVSVSLPAEISVAELAEQLNRKPFHIIRHLIHLKIFASPETRLERGVAEMICAALGVKCL